jgi:hypothetical protein
MMHCGYCHHSGGLGSDVAELHGLGSESTPTTSLGYAAACGGNDRRDLTTNVFHFLIQFAIGTDANASPFCKALLRFIGFLCKLLQSPT